MSIIGGVSAGILTQGLPIRNQMLYTAELRRRLRDGIIQLAD